jgi:hypothetical protein
MTANKNQIKRRHLLRFMKSVIGVRAKCVSLKKKQKSTLRDTLKKKKIGLFGAGYNKM